MAFYNVRRLRYAAKGSFEITLQYHDGAVVDINRPLRRNPYYTFQWFLPVVDQFQAFERRIKIILQPCPAADGTCKIEMMKNGMCFIVRENGKVV